MNGGAGDEGGLAAFAVEARAPAKLNLFLHVTGRRDDGPQAGYHTLDSYIAFLDLADALTVRAAAPGTFRLAFDGPFADRPGLAGDDNLVIRAARALDDYAARDGKGPFGCDIRLVKNIPVAAGLGGGSADAAATLRALARLWHLPDAPLADIALALGADVPVCLDSTSARVQGIGEDIAAAPILPAMGFVLANPGVAVETGAVFRALDKEPPAPVTPPRMPPRGFADADALVAFLDGTGNELTASARQIAPEISDVLTALGALPGCRLARMAGSGATCFAIFDTLQAAEQAARALRKDHDNWWVWAGVPGRD